LEDGILSSEEKVQLEIVRERLGLNLNDTDAMTLSEFALIRELEHSQCPHCGKSLFDTHHNPIQHST